MRRAAYLAAALAFAAPAAAQDAPNGIVVKQAWSRATPVNARVAAGYFTVANNGKSADRLLSVSSPAAESVEIHESSVVDGIARMRPVDAVAIAPGATVTLKPGGLHLMMMQPRAKLTPGDKIAVTLVFEKAGEIVANLSVQPAGATNAPADDQAGRVQ